VPAGYDPCTEAYVTRYFNREDVQRALHANRTGLPYPYSTCRSARQHSSLGLSLHAVALPAGVPCARRDHSQLLIHDHDPSAAMNTPAVQPRPVPSQIWRGCNLHAAH